MGRCRLIIEIETISSALQQSRTTRIIIDESYLTLLLALLLRSTKWKR